MRQSNEAATPSRRRALAVAALAGLVALGGLSAAPGAFAKSKQGPKAVPVKVMTRNLFLGADLGPALRASSFPGFVAANGAILREVDSTNFPVRARGLAAEIRQRKPDLVGLQEAAWWRTAPQDPSKPYAQGPDTGQYTATTTKYDFLQLLLDQLNADTDQRYRGYRLAVVGTEFDFEAPADYDNDPNTGSLFGGEIEGRLTMRDAILVRKGSDVKVKRPRSGQFSTLYTPNISGITVPVTRGWVSVDAKATAGKGKHRVSRRFRFVDTHLESFDDETQHPSIRAQQAAELLAGPASARKTILVGDLNSNVPPVKPGDEQAYQTLLAGGFSERSTSDPLGCCVNSVISGPASGFDHKVDHVMTNESRKKVRLARSAVTGLSQANGFYDSDHAGLFSALKLR